LAGKTIGEGKMAPRTVRKDVTDYLSSHKTIKLSELIGTKQYVEVKLKSGGKVFIHLLPCTGIKLGQVYDLLIVHGERTAGDFRDTVCFDEMEEGTKWAYTALGGQLWQIDIDKLFICRYPRPIP
jgi:hypothetical protein